MLLDLPEKQTRTLQSAAQASGRERELTQSAIAWRENSLSLSRFPSLNVLRSQPSNKEGSYSDQPSSLPNSEGFLDTTRGRGRERGRKLVRCLACSLLGWLEKAQEFLLAAAKVRESCQFSSCFATSCLSLPFQRISPACLLASKHQAC